uniref:Extracellular calcium-sensing receptor-like n=1 Tax=Erpetoichthys calabaricus TaxID=27687 RepID=A0A8C4S314_ERPCA
MLFCVAVLLMPFSIKAEGHNCNMQGAELVPQLSKDGDIIIGAIFSLHRKTGNRDLSYKSKPEPLQCERFGQTFAQTTIYAIEEINNNTELLPNISIGYKIYDSCASVPVSMRAVMTLMNEKQNELSYNDSCKKPFFVPAIIAESGSSPTMAIAKTAGPFQIPVVSHFATCACLSNRHEFPTFFRTIPSDFYQSRALAQLVKHFGWTWVGAIRSDNDYGNSGMATFVQAAQQEGICIEYSEPFFRTYTKENILRIINIIKMSTSKVIVAFLAQSDMSVLLQDLIKENLTDIQWVGSEAWVTDTNIATKENCRILGGALGFAIRKSWIPGLKEFLLKIHPSAITGNALLKEFWETTFSCYLNDNITADMKSAGMRACSGTENLNGINNLYTDVTELRISNNVYKAVNAIAHALHNMFTCTTRENHESCAKSVFFEPWKLLHFMKMVKFRTKYGEEVYFDENGDPAAIYELINWQLNAKGENEFVTVGYYDATAISGQNFLINNTKIIWIGGKRELHKSICSESCIFGTRRAMRKGKPVCCFDCIPCAEGEMSNATDSSDCIKCPMEYWSNAKKDKCIFKETEHLSFEEILGILLTAVSLMGVCITLVTAFIFFLYKHTPIVKANNSELSFLLLFSLTLCFLCSVTFIGRPSDWSCMLRHTAFGITFVLCISCVLGKTIVVLMAFRATQPGSSVMKWFGASQQRLCVFVITSLQSLICFLWLLIAPPSADRNFSYYRDKIILECNVGSQTAFYAVLGYIGLLSSLCFILAFKARTLPDNFNEAKFITFSMLIFCAVWITFIPVYISSPGKYIVVVEIFAILASSFGLLFCIFTPKCYIILFKPHRNTKKKPTRSWGEHVNSTPHVNFYIYILYIKNYYKNDDTFTQGKKQD